MPTDRSTAVAKGACQKPSYDAVVVGSGPNGLACAIAMARAGSSVLVVEAQPTPGGACRTMELTLPGVKHDVCSAVYPLGLGSPFFRTLPLERYGLRWLNPAGAYVHAFRPEQPLVIERDLHATAANIGAGGDSFARLMSSLLPDWNELCDALLQPLKVLKHPVSLARFGAKALLSAQALANDYLASAEARAAFAGVAAHGCVPFDETASASVGLALSIAAHAVGWPIPVGGAQSITDSLIEHLRSLGGELLLNCPVRSLDELPACRFLFLDVTPRQFMRMTYHRLSERQRRLLGHYRYGPSVFKIDWTLSSPIPWTSPDYLRAPTVHLAGTFDDIARGEGMVAAGNEPASPYILLAQPTIFDTTRAPEGTHVVWAYTHIPYGSADDRVDAMESLIERYAPGFRASVLARSILTPQRLEELDANHVGGDINGGALSFAQLLTRPSPRLIPYKTDLPNVFFCSSSTPPGSGVHGMCGYYAAWFALHIGSRNRWAIRDSLAVRTSTSAIKHRQAG